jgi:hypothetical protein
VNVHRRNYQRFLLVQCEPEFADKVALHQFETRPSGFVTMSMRPPNPPLRSPVMLKTAYRAAVWIPRLTGLRHATIHMFGRL